MYYNSLAFGKFPVLKVCWNTFKKNFAPNSDQSEHGLMSEKRSIWMLWTIKKITLKGWWRDFEGEKKKKKWHTGGEGGKIVKRFGW